jgi:two-component system, response regulator PdtaR
MSKVLIAEDEFMIAEMLNEAAIEGGYEVCGIAAEAAEVIALGEQHRPDLAIIDLRLAGGSDGLEAARELRRRVKLGILFASGNCHRVIAEPPPAGEACLNKPFTRRDVVQALRVVEEIVRSGAPPRPLPVKLHLLQQRSI